MRAYNIIKELWKKNRNFCSSDYDNSIKFLQAILPLKKIRFKNNPVKNNGWVIPPKWDLKNAWIKYNGEVILDGTENPLQVIGLSKSVRTNVTLEELKKHLYWVTPNNIGKDAIPYHFRQNYQSWSRDWGFCVSSTFYDSLKEGHYEVLIETRESEGYLDILEYTKKGSLPYCFYFIAHLDHPGMANDDLSGVAVGIELFERISSLSTKFTYKLLIVQEIIGSQYYLNNLNSDRTYALGGLFLEMLGSQTDLALQKSFRGKSIIDKQLASVLQSNVQRFRIEKFGEVIGNDEIVFESFGIPTSSLSRFPYPEYHSNKDNLDIINENCLDESIHLLQELIKKLEQQQLVKKLYHGIPCLSNPGIDLYVDTGQFEKKDSKKMEWRKLMDGISFLEFPTTIQEICSYFSLPEKQIENYLKKWEDKGLIEIF